MAAAQPDVPLTHRRLLFILAVMLGMFPRRARSDEYRDLGAATSGVTFFRAIGSAFGVALFGAIFAGRLQPQLAARLSGQALPAGFDPTRLEIAPGVLASLPAPVHGGIIDAYTASLQPLFLSAVPLRPAGVRVRASAQRAAAARDRASGRRSRRPGVAGRRAVGGRNRTRGERAHRP
jgi:hypothetical protein